MLRGESAPPPPRPFERFLADRVEYVADTQELRTPTDLRLTALDRTSLRASWTADGGLGPGGFEVRWNGRTRLVQGTETELTELDTNADVAVEVRAVDGLGNRSAPATASAVPRLAYDEGASEGLYPPIDLFDGPEALSPHRWRVLARDDDECLGLRPFNGRRVEITCDLLDLQSNVPLTLAGPHSDGALGRAVLTTDGPLTSDGELGIALLPEPFQDAAELDDSAPPGSVVLRITSTHVRFEVGAGVPTTDEVVPAGGTFTLPASGVRHRWELRVLPRAVVALRDGVALAGAPVAVPWRTARPRLVFREARNTLLDSFASGGGPASPVPAWVVREDSAQSSGRGVLLGTVTAQELAGGTSVRVLAEVFADHGTPVTLEFGSRSAPATYMPASDSLSQDHVVYADFPLPVPDGSPTGVRLRADDELFARSLHLVVTGEPDTRVLLPALTDRGAPEPRVPAPVITVHRDSDQRDPDRQDSDQQGTTTVRVVVELSDPAAREVAAVKGLEVDFDGERIATLPTNGAAGGRHEFVLARDDLPTGGHKVAVRVLPVDERAEVRTQEHDFQIRPL